MTNYKYQAISRDGARVSGVVEAFNEMDAVERIKQNASIILKVEEVKEKAPSILDREIGGSKLDVKAFTLMCNQFAIILRAGIPITRTVDLIGKKMTDKKLKKLLEEVSDDIRGGRALSASFEERGGDFLPILFIETMKAGELSGNFESAFESMAEHFKRQTRMKQRVKGALTYPIFVLIIAVIVVIVLMVKVVPTFTEVFASYGAELPMITQVLIAISNFFRRFWLAMLVIICVLYICYKLYKASPSGKLKCAELALKLPAFGEINVLNGASQFSNNLSALLQAGITITEALRVTARIMTNAYLSSKIGRMAGKLEEGNSLGDCLRREPILPDILVDMVNVGEETGELDETLGTIAEYYDNELEVAINSVMGKLEPALLVFVAGVAGFIVIAIYIAMFRLYAVM